MKIVALGLLIGLLFAGLLGCGGGGSSSAVFVPPIIPRVVSLQVQYWGTSDATVKDEAAETGSVFACWGDIANQLRDARSVGATVATVCAGDDPRATLNVLRDAGVLAGWQHFYLFIKDEGEQDGWTDATFAAAASGARTALADYPEVTARLEVNYGCGNEFIGWRYFDVIGCDRYDRSAQETLGNLKSKAPGKQYRLYAGVSSPWQVDPAPYVRLGLCDSSIEGITYFMRYTVTDRGKTYVGSAENGMGPVVAAASGLARAGRCGG